MKELLDILKRFEVTEIPPGVMETEIEAFEGDIGISLPPELAAWLKLTNGPFVGTQGLFGIYRDSKYFNIDYYLILFEPWREKRWIPIATDGSGNYYVVSTIQEYGAGFPVMFIDTIEDPFSPSYLVASGVKRFLWFFIHDALGLSTWHWSFNKEEVLLQDPEIKNYVGVRLPWEAS